MQYFFYCHHEHEHSNGRLDRANVMSIHEAIDYAFHLIDGEESKMEGFDVTLEMYEFGGNGSIEYRMGFNAEERMSAVLLCNEPISMWKYSCEFLFSTCLIDAKKPTKEQIERSIALHFMNALCPCLPPYGEEEFHD